jgi:protoheme IX farnesyltransferase
MLVVGGYCMVGASNVFNQIIEKDLDAKMDRTKNRPIVTGKVSKNQAFVLGTALTILGLTILYLINPKTAMFGAISIFIYVSLYTPLKTVTPLSVFVGALPGAIPFMLGWVAATGDFGIEAGTLFIIQFFWQFPHFWAIAWVTDEDYKKAGFKMLPNDGKKNLKTAFTIMIYTVFLVPLAFVPYMLQMTGINSAIIAVTTSALFLSQTFYLMMKPTDKSAKWMMFGSFLYLPILQIAYLFDKI